MKLSNQQFNTENNQINEPLVRFNDVSLSYDRNLSNKNGQSYLALDKVNLSLSAGGVYFLIGPSGAGKSSLLKLMYLALRPSSGQIKMLGADVTAATREELPHLRRQIGVVFQDFRLLPHLNLYENLALPFRVRNLPEEEYHDDVEDLLNWVGLGKKIRDLPETLSGGEQQRVAIARAVISKPKLLIADEPTGNVDPKMGKRLIRLILELNKWGGATIVIATHDHDIVQSLGNPVLTIEGGKLTQHDKPPKNFGYFGSSAEKK